jgi:hypothetical protein
MFVIKITRVHTYHSSNRFADHKHCKVTKLITACKTLRIFECTVSVTRDSELYRWYTHVSRSIIGHAGSLRRLVMEEPTWPEGSRYGSLSNLCDLKYLETLRLPYEILVGNEETVNIPRHLPASLEYLNLVFRDGESMTWWEDIDSIVTQISEALCSAALTGSLPNIKGVELTLLTSYKNLFIPTFKIDSFRSALRERSISLDVAMVCLHPVGKSTYYVL